METVGIADSHCHPSANPLPRFHLVIDLGSYGELVAPLIIKNRKVQRPNKEVQIDRRSVQVGFGRRCGANTQRLHDSAQNKWPFLGGAPLAKYIRHLSGPFLLLAPSLVFRQKTVRKRQKIRRATQHCSPLNSTTKREIQNTDRRSNARETGSGTHRINSNYARRRFAAPLLHSIP